MSVETEAISVLTKEIIKTIKAIVNESSFDKTKKGLVVKHLHGKYYEVKIGSDIYKAYSPIVTCKENDIVYVKIAENNYNNLIIEYVI